VIVADSSYFIGLADRKDRWHADALRIRRREPPEYLVTDLTVAQAVTIIGNSASISRVSLIKSAEALLK
jgi:predicted nucleic acid-binding protein